MVDARDLPVEILETIFSLVLFHTCRVPQIWQQPDYEDPLWRNEASEIGYTCRAFNHVIKTLLFRRLNLKDLKSLMKLGSFVEKSDKLGTGLASCIRWLFLDTRCTGDESNMVRRALVEILTRCPNIDYLSIGFIDVPSDEPLILPHIHTRLKSSSVKSLTLRFTQKPYQSAYRLNDRNRITLNTVLPPTYSLFIKHLTPNLRSLELQDIDFSRMALTIQVKQRRRTQKGKKRVKVEDSVFYRRSNYFELTLDTIRVLILNRCTLDPSETISKFEPSSQHQRDKDIDYFEDIPDTSAFLAITFRYISSLFFLQEPPAGLGSLTRLFKNLTRLYLHKHPMVRLNIIDALPEPTMNLALSLILLQQLDVLEAINFNYLPSFLKYFDDKEISPLRMKRLVVKDDYRYGDSSMLKEMICKFFDTISVSSGKTKFTTLYETNPNRTNSQDYRTMFCPLLQVTEFLGVEVWTFRASMGQSHHSDTLPNFNSLLLDPLPVTIPLHGRLRGDENLFPTDTIDVSFKSKILRTPLVKLAVQKSTQTMNVSHPISNSQGLVAIQTAPLATLPWIDL